MEAVEAVSGVDVGRLQVEDGDLPGSPNWVARFTILEGDPDGQFKIYTDSRTNEGVLSVVKVRHASAMCFPLRPNLSRASSRGSCSLSCSESLPRMAVLADLLG